MRTWIWMLAVLAGAGLSAPSTARADARDELAAYVLRAAEGDFDAVRGEAGLSGSTPLLGLEPLARPVARRARDKGRRVEQAGPETKRASGLAPRASGGRP